MSKNSFQQLTSEEYNILCHEYGLDRPLVIQYYNWISDAFRGDFGTSINYSQKVSELIRQRLPISLHLGVLSLIFSVIFGILAGILSAIRRNTWLDTVITFLANIGITIPIFWLGILMVYVFGLILHWLPVQGYTSPFDNFWLSTKGIIMPVICLSLLPIAATARQTRSSMLEVVQQDYIRTAWSKGLDESRIIIRHTLKNGLIPVITLIGFQVANIFAGSVLVETVFNIPGLGRLLVTAVFAQDFMVVQGCSLLIAIGVMLTNLVVDISYGWLNPTIRYG